MRRPDWTVLARVAVTIALGGIGASAGFTHTHDWATAHGQHGWLAWADAVVIEGMAVVAGFEVHRDHHNGRKGITLPQVVLVVAFLIQMTAQVAQAEPTPAGWLLAAMPALGFLTVVKLIMRRVPGPTRPDDSARQADPADDQDTRGTVPSPVAGMLSRLPVRVRDSVITTAQDAHRDGRQVTGEDIRRTIALPEAMLTAVVTELNDTVNHRPIIHTEHTT
jgi:Protein of unknown function (DUF2637)